MTFFSRLFATPATKKSDANEGAQPKEKSLLHQRMEEQIEEVSPTKYTPYGGSAENEAGLMRAMEEIAHIDSQSSGWEQLQDTGIWGTEEMSYFNKLKEEAGSFKGILAQLEAELKQGKLTQRNYNTLRHSSLRLAEEIFHKVDVFFDQQSQRYVVAHPDQFFTKPVMDHIRAHPEEFPEF